MLQLRSKDYRSVATVQMQAITSKAKESAMLIFNRYGDQYFFAQVWLDGDPEGLQAPKSRAERFAQRELAGMKPAAATVALKNR